MSKLEIDSIFDLNSPNFEDYFERMMNMLTPEQRSRIPDRIKKKLITNKGEIKIGKTTFMERLFTLVCAGGNRFTITIEPPIGENVLSVEDYYKQKASKNESAIESAKDLVDKGTFVLADRDLIKYSFHLSDISASGAYKHFTKLKNSKETSLYKNEQSLNYLIKVLLNYEGNKSKIVRDFGVTPAEFCSLLYFYNGEIRSSANLVEDVMKWAFNMNKQTLTRAISSLISKKMMERHGKKFETKYRITPIGIKRVNDIIQKIIL